MEFTNSFSVDAPLQTVWLFMLNAEEVAPCVPGAAITEKVDDRQFKGTVKIKLGAVQMSYRGELFMEADEAARTITLKAKGTETRGSGGASGSFVTSLSEREGGGTEVVIVSQVDVTGRVAQFGRGIMQDVATRLIKDFAACLESKLRAGPQGPVASAAPAANDNVAHPNVPGVDTSQESLPPAVAASSTRVPTQPAQTELRVGRIVAELARSRLARGLRSIANRIEPRGE